mgnify:FL=1
MGFRFRRSFGIAPGLRLNLSRSGISATVGPRGAHLTMGNAAPSVSVGIPGTGISYRQSFKDCESGEVPIPPGHHSRWVWAVAIALLLLVVLV